MGFTQGQIAFALFFIVSFVVVLFFAYRKDLKLQPGYFKGTLKIIIYMIIIYVSFYALIHFIH